MSHQGQGGDRVRSLCPRCSHYGGVTGPSVFLDSAADFSSRERGKYESQAGENRMGRLRLQRLSWA